MGLLLDILHDMDDMKIGDAIEVAIQMREAHDLSWEERDALAVLCNAAKDSPRYLAERAEMGHTSA